MAVVVVILIIVVVIIIIVKMSNKNSEIGKKGPAGGIIFYDKGNDNDGWRYLEVAPADTEFNAEWGVDLEDVSGTKTGIGYGKSNTQVIAKFLNNIGEKDKAAQRCLALNINGHNDWFLPSKDELNLMYQNLREKGLGDFGKGNNSEEWMDVFYWSSSQYDTDYNRSAWYQIFNSFEQETKYIGVQDTNYKIYPYRVRAVRAFKILDNKPNEINPQQNKNQVTSQPIVKPSATLYNIGDTGPASGTIFYDKGNFTDGWRYLEAAPTNTEFKAEWGVYTGNKDDGNFKGVDVPDTQNEIGAGRANTQKIIAKLQQLGETDRAAQKCVAMNIGGKNDWFIPSLDELNLMYQNLYIKGFGDFVPKSYWSSSQYLNYNGSAWRQHFKSGAKQYKYKYRTYRVRAIRAF